MHIVYLMEFHREELPNKYIGSKSNCQVIDNRIYGNRGLYEGSSRDKGFREAITSNVSYTLHVLGEFETYDLALLNEKNIHIAHDVVASPEYFNKSIATISSFADPEYGTYKHTVTGKTARLRLDHPLVISGEWVGITRGRVLNAEERKSRGLPGELNPFYGKQHTSENRAMFSALARNTFKGKTKSDEQKAKMSESAKRIWNERRQKNNQDYESGKSQSL